MLERNHFSLVSLIPFRKVPGGGAERPLLLPQSLAYDVPQGLVLSPVLFNMYMKLLAKVTRRFELRCH